MQFEFLWKRIGVDSGDVSPLVGCFGGGEAGDLTECHPDRLHAENGHGDVGAREGDGDDQVIDGLGQ